MSGQDDFVAVSIRRGGRVATDPDGRAIGIEADTCRAVLADRHGVRQCSRRGWLALWTPEADLVQPLCSTHLHRLIKQGGAIRGEHGGRDGR